MRVVREIFRSGTPPMDEGDGRDVVHESEDGRDDVETHACVTVLMFGAHENGE